MSTLSKTDIAVMALDHLGKGPIESIDDEGSTAAKVMKRWYDHALDMALGAYNWNFARKRRTLAAHDDAPPTGWDYRYQYPEDCVVAREIAKSDPAMDAIPFEIESDEAGNANSILTNEPAAVLVYTFRQPNTAVYTALFVDLLSLALAYYAAFTLTAKRSMKGDMAQQFQGLLRTAPAQNANEHADAPPRDSESIRGRA